MITSITSYISVIRETSVERYLKKTGIKVRISLLVLKFISLCNRMRFNPDDEIMNRNEFAEAVYNSNDSPMHSDQEKGRAC